MELQKQHHHTLMQVILVLFFAGLGLLAGWYHLSTQPQHWKVSAKFSPPQTAELGNYYSLKTTYHKVKVKEDGLASAESNKDNEAQIIQNTYNTFTQTLTALDNRLDFLTSHETVRQIAQAYNQPINVFARQLADKLEFETASQTLNFTLANPEQATQILNDFIRIISVKTRDNLNNDLIQKWQLLFRHVKQSAEANLGESWQEKLNTMRSVQALDNQLVPYRLVQKPIVASQPEKPENYAITLFFSTLMGLLIGLLVIALRRK